MDTTGRALKAGQDYFSTYEIFFPFFAIGVTDFFAISGGMTLFPGAEQQIFYFAPKITPINVKDFNLAGGVYERRQRLFFGLYAYLEKADNSYLDIINRNDSLFFDIEKPVVICNLFWVNDGYGHNKLLDPCLPRMWM